MDCNGLALGIDVKGLPCFHLHMDMWLVVIVRGLSKGRWGVGVRVHILYPSCTLLVPLPLRRVHKGTQIPLRFLRGKTFSTF